MTFERLVRLVSEFKYRDWQFVAGRIDDVHYYVQVWFNAPDTKTGVVGVQHSGKFLVSAHAAQNEVLRTVHACVTSAVLHEMNEELTVSGVALWHPHISALAIVGAALEHHEYRA